MSRALILTYHMIEEGPPPLCVDAELFSRHVACIVESGAHVQTIGELAAAVRNDRVPERAVAITFDDGFASVISAARPVLAERGFPATVFCVATRLGASNDWPSQASWAPRRPLAGPTDLAGLAAEGWEIGAHGLAHDALDGLGLDALRRELIESRRLLEAQVGAPVRSFTYPYGVAPRGAKAMLAETGYGAACTSRVGIVRTATDPFALPRVDAHYVRRPELLRAALAGRLDLYLLARELGARARRVVRRDYVSGRA